jgi:hypothetical protein
MASWKLLALKQLCSSHATASSPPNQFAARGTALTLRPREGIWADLAALLSHGERALLGYVRVSTISAPPLGFAFDH